ncbi:MAG: Sensor histidine kinase ResE [Fimbriimonadaceae bacterium]|nr:Sensor histidine kinase ResE [Fimbriimonadaceae bacterium]
MDRLIRRLLLLARSDAGQLIQGSQDVDLVDLCAEFQKPAAGGEPAVQFDAPEGPLFVFGDPDLLSRAIGNLVENAVRHTPSSGHVTLRLASDSDEIRVTVEDDGEGIPPEALPHVFERFFRVDSARSRSEGGAGLGLAIVKSVAQAHGGSVAIDSELGKGTKVTLRLPQKR